jgi:hypothetical protein
MASNGLPTAGQVTPGEDPTRTPNPRRVGRPSAVAPYAFQIGQWLREDPALSGAEILQRARLAGYRGGKSALYELRKRLQLLLEISR